MYQAKFYFLWALCLSLWDNHLNDFQMSKAANEISIYNITHKLVQQAYAQTRSWGGHDGRSNAIDPLNHCFRLH